jgi:hypothetical protein
MSEEKVIQHSQKAVTLLKSRSLSIKAKILGFLEEIVIIVIAVSLTLAFHNWNDLRHDREIERNFLTGIRQDLVKTVASIESGIKWYQPTIDYYDTVWRQINSHKINAAYIDAKSGDLTNTMYLTYDGSRFEGFKSSGYLRLIQNQDLLKDLTRVYSVELPFQKDMDVLTFQKRAQEFNQYIGSKALIDSSGVIHISELLNEREVRYQIFYYRFTLHERQEHKEVLTKRLQALISEIDKELNS